LPLPEEESRKPLDGVLNVLRGAHLPVEIFLLLAGEKVLEVWHPSAPGYLA